MALESIYEHRVMNGSHKNIPRHGGAVVSGEHEHHLDELGRPLRHPALEPEQRNDTADPDLLLEDL
jgi:hypothetical protein